MHTVALPGPTALPYWPPSNDPISPIRLNNREHRIRSNESLAHLITDQLPPSSLIALCRPPHACPVIAHTQTTK